MPIVEALSYFTDPIYWVAFSSALLLAAVAGLMPGVSASLIMAISIPFIVLNISDPLIGIVMLATLTGVDNTLDSIPAILLGQPGASTQVTFIEGNQLARRGLGAYALGGTYAVSAIGGIVGAIVLLGVIPVIKPFILAFSFAEIGAMALFGVAMVAALSTGAMVKGLAAAAFGLLLGTIGIDPFTGEERYVFGSLHLWEGLPLIATTIGLFALPEMIDLTMTRQPVSTAGGAVNTGEVMRGFRAGLARWKVAIRQSLFGVFLGAVPGIGSAVVDWLAYSFGIFWSKDKSQFGKGSFDGLLFAESAQNSKEGGQAIPTLAFGVPGGRAWAFVVVAMLAYGISPGPPMLDRYAHITIMMVMSLGLANLFMTMIALVLTGQLAKLTLIPYPMIGAIIIPISFLSAFQNVTDIIAIWIVLAAGGLGLLMKQYKWPRPPLLLGFILGPIIDHNFQSAINIYGLGGVMTRPLTIALILLAVGTAFAFAKMSRVSTPAESLAVPLIGPGPASGGSEDTLAETRPRVRPHLSADSVFTFAMIAMAVVAIAIAMDYPARASKYPMILAGVIIVLSLVQLFFESTRPRTGDIMDIGMRSAGMAGARRTGIIVFGLLGAFIVLMLLIGMKYASVLFAIATPLLLMQGRARWIGVAIAAVFVITFNMVLMDRIMNVYWPVPIIGLWGAG